MSTNADCRIYESQPNEWWYKIQRWPYGETTEYNAYGPFTTKDAAIDHILQFQSNPGGWSIQPYEQQG